MQAPAHHTGMRTPAAEARAGPPPVTAYPPRAEPDDTFTELSISASETARELVGEAQDPARLHLFPLADLVTRALLAVVGNADAHSSFQIPTALRCPNPGTWRPELVLQMPRKQSTLAKLLISPRQSQKLRRLSFSPVTPSLFCLVRLSRHYLPPVADYGEKNESEVRKSPTLEKR